MKRFIWKMRRFKRTFTRNYKGVFDILAVILFVAGVIAVMYGVMLALCEEYVSIIYISGGFMGLCMADDFIWLNRRRNRRGSRS